MKTLEIQKHKSLSEVVYDQLKQQILAGSIAPGTRMMEVELSEKMGVSRTPIREAIRMLEKEGLVEIRPRHGAYSSEVSKEEILGILEVRQHIDGLAAQLAAQRGTAEEKATIAQYAKEYAEAFAKLGNGVNSNELIACDEKFHESIAAASHNNTLLNMVTELQNLVIRFRYIYYTNPDVMARMLSEHEEIVETIRSGNGDGASQVARDHIDGLVNFIREYHQGDER